MWLLALHFYACMNHAAFSQKVQVTTPLGKILGTTMTTRLGKTIYAFKGIRYARPPIGELRFQPPVPIEEWSEVYNATSDGPACPQPTNDPVSEDCLVLNVYTTKLPDCIQDLKRPVMVHLHAGGFYSATGRSNWAGPQYFMDQKIVLVTLNYRLGFLGFISVGKEAPGNNGLKDQVVALKWVKNNIASFGGDPDSITLYGYSAGSWSITLHMVSPMSKGLFHKAILGSGSALGHWPLPRHQLEVAKRQARVVGCPDTNAKDIIGCLKTKSAEELGTSLLNMTEFGSNPILIWSPVIEDDFGQERFLTDNPINLIKNGAFANIPVIAGITKDEVGNMAFPIVNNATLLQELNNNFEKYAPICFIYERRTNKSVELYADSVVGFPTNRAVMLLAEKNSQPVYYYEFTYQGRYSHFYLPGTETPYGGVHHDDLIYTFYISTLFPFFNSSFPEANMVNTLTSLWATFAQNGNPVDCSNQMFESTEWTPYNTSTKKFLVIPNSYC